jgi:hypothetical protein
MLLGICHLGIAADVSEAAPTNSPPWRLESESGGVALYSSVHPGSSLKRFKAVGLIEAPTRVVHNVLDDVEGYPKFMPFTAECRILKREADEFFAYQRISPKIVSDRDYTIRIRQKSWPRDGGTCYTSDWEPANECGPAERKGVLRVKLCEGGWLLEPDHTVKTRATYSIFTDNGGRLPAFLANAASGIGIRKIFVAVRRQVKDPKYYEDRDFLGAAR